MSEYEKNKTIMVKRKSLTELYKDLDNISYSFTKVQGHISNNNEIINNRKAFIQSL